MKKLRLPHWKKALSASALSTVLLVTACGGGSSEPQQTADGKPILRVLTSSSPLAPPDPNEKLVVKRLEEKTGVHIDWTSYTSDVFAEKRNLAMASGDLPDAVFAAEYSDYDLLKLAKDGAIVPLEDAIDRHMPNFKKVLDEHPEYRSMITAPDGHIYAFPWIEELGSGKERIQSVDDMPWINVEWLKKLGLEMPKTTDELKEVLTAFKTKDPNGNGKADEIPLSFIDKPGGENLTFLFAAFGLGENPEHLVVTDEGKVVFTGTEPGYKDAVNYVYDLYKNKLVDIESFQQDWNTYVAKGKDDRYGLYFTWDKANITGMNDKYDLMPPVAGPSGEVNVTRNNGMGFFRGSMVVTSTNKQLETTAKWVDQLYDPLQSVQNNWGTYGDETQQNIFEFDEAKKMLKHLPLEGSAPVELRQKTSIGGPLAILDEYFGKYTTMPDDAKWRMDLMEKVLVPHMKAENTYPNVFFSIEELDRLSTIEADLFPYMLRKRTEWYQNGKADQEWDAYLAELDRLGLQEWLKIRQDGYDRSAVKS
ncbi:ABC transporter substrate-binding protein [Saccharibacillus deserti]|uniref:ABC transporter substrate-binding protein n=1 Tax=Saccharibacillus deserti TaxID=1634444 RepID=UPI001552ACFC|nr:ABC transporter substrate-binding protein [Saccharibacillus deserti]